MIRPLSQSFFACVATSILMACSVKGGGSTDSGTGAHSSITTASSASTARVVRDYTRARVLNAAIGKGMNMGNALDAPQEGAWGVTIDSSWFPLLKQAGFTSIRLPVRWDSHLDVLNGIDPTYMARVKQVVSQAIGAGLVVVMDVHHFDALTDTNGADLGTAQAEFYAIWTQISAEFQAFSNDSLVFELLNEPRQRMIPSVYNPMIAITDSIIRATNPSRTIMIDLDHMAKWAGAGNLVLPPNESNVIIAVHYYDPVNFTFQGDPTSNYKDTGVTWGATMDQQSMLGAFQAIKIGDDTIFPGTDGVGAPINIGEFGTYGGIPANERAIWNKYVHTDAQKFNFSWNYWEFCSSYGVYDAYGKQWKPGMLASLIP